MPIAMAGHANVTPIAIRKLQKVTAMEIANCHDILVEAKDLLETQDDRWSAARAHMRTREALARLQGCRRQLDSQSGLAGRQGAERNQIGDQLHYLKAVELAVKDVETIYSTFVANLQTAYGANFTRDCDGLSMRDRELLASLLLAYEGLRNPPKFLAPDNWARIG